jgi:hypothetical protein
MNQQHEDNRNYEDENQVIQRSKYVKIGFFIFIAYFLWMEHRAHVIEYLPFIILAACPLMHFFMHKGHGHQDSQGGDKNGKES